MKKNLRYALVTVAFLFGPFLVAAQPPDLGHFRGLAFSSATERHPLEIEGGNLVRCETNPSSHADITRCEVEKGSLVVTGAEGNHLKVKLVRVAVLRTAGKTPSRNYYFRGATDLMIGGQLVAVQAQVTLNWEDALPSRVRGFIDLPAQSARTSLEAYLVP